MRDDLEEVRKNTDTIPQINEELKQCERPRMQRLEIKGMREDIQPGYAMDFRQMQSDVRAIKERLGMP